MGAWIGSPDPYQYPRVERIFQHLIHGAQCDRLTAYSFPLDRAQTELIACNLPNLTGAVRSSKHQVKQPADQYETLRVRNDRPGALIIQITERRLVRTPPSFHLS